MATPKPPRLVKLVVGLLASSDALLAAARQVLSDRFGPIDAASNVIAWALSTYYRAEMGEAIRRQFLSFERLIAPGKLAGFKQMTNELEDAWRTAGGRHVNIDPGYLAATKLVLASTKDAAHRVYLSGGIYAEATLQFSNGSFGPYPCTYPDYAAADAIAFFGRVRATYLAQLRLQSTTPTGSNLH
ncbi:MAG: DUF4416 family protein [Candidatus Binatia bacterium]